MKNPGDIDAMSEIMWAGSLSHNNLTGLGGKKDFSVHQFGQAIGEKFDIYHGETLSATWASYARYGRADELRPLCAVRTERLGR